MEASTLQTGAGTSLQLEEKQGVRLAIEGCGHGTLHAIYASVNEACQQKGWPDVNLLIIGGDFQAVRNAYDLNVVNMPAKYRSMGDFHEYYSGHRNAPYLTIFVGGNHEASNYLFELYYGGWVAPNIYYMGAANVLRFGPLRIAGLSGIWKGYNHHKPHHERIPYNETDKMSIYHVRELDVRKLLQIKTQVDIGISHDWPRGVVWKGNWKQLFRFKPFLEEDAREGQLGSVAAQQVMDRLRPRFWFSAHLHCKYAAIVDHEKRNVQQRPLPAFDTAQGRSRNDGEIDLMGEEEVGTTFTFGRDERVHEASGLGMADGSSGRGRPAPDNTDEVDLDLEDDANARAALPDSFRRPANPEPKPEPAVQPPAITNLHTKFLALDKCLPEHHFLQLTNISSDVDIDSMRPLTLEYDREWLAITRTFAIDEPLELGKPDAEIPKPKSHAEYEEMIEKRRDWIDQNLRDADLIVPANFEIIAPVYDGGDWTQPEYAQVQEYPNPQTERFCKLLQIPNPFDISDEDRRMRSTMPVGYNTDLRHLLTTIPKNLVFSGPRPDPDAKKFRGKKGRGGRGQGRGGGQGSRGGRGGGDGRGGGGGGGGGGWRGGGGGRSGFRGH